MQEPPRPHLPLRVVTTETIAGWRIVQSLGYVEGHFSGGGRSLQHAVVDLATKAQPMGASAVVAARRTGSTIYGTAVVIAPEAG